MGYLTLVFETLFLFVFWFRKCRVICLIIGVGLHLGIFFVFPIPWFALSVATVYILLVPVKWWKKTGVLFKRGKKKLLTFYYDEECPLCMRTVIVIKHFDIFSKITFKGVQSHHDDEEIKGIETEELLNSVYSINHKGKRFSGLDTYIRVFFSIRYLIPMAILLRIPGIYHLANICYKYFAANRVVERCTEDNCGYTPPTLPQNVDNIKILRNLTVLNLRVVFITIGLLSIITIQSFISYDSSAIASKSLQIPFLAVTVFYRGTPHY